MALRTARRPHLLLTLSATLLVAACAGAQSDASPSAEPRASSSQGATSLREVSPSPALTATLYTHSAAEHHASTRAIYAGAAAMLDQALADPSWTAALEQGEDAAQKPPAVILDVDETVLDNSPYQVKAMKEALVYPDGWNEWCDLAEAEPVAGALEFTRLAANKGVTVFYVTNREHAVEAGTRRNLEAAGFPLAEGVDVILTKRERPEWTSDKTTRRQLVAADYRIIMLFGDNLGDFVDHASAKGSTLAEREAVVVEHADKWGTRWFPIPNPMYGYWDSVTYGHGDYLSPEANSGRLDAMRPAP